MKADISTLHKQDILILQRHEVAAAGKIHQSQNQPVRTLLDDAGEALLVMSKTEEGANQE